MGQREVPKIRLDRVTLFDALMAMADQMSPEMRRDIGRILLVLLACADDRRLDKDRVAMIAARMGAGELCFGD